MKARLFTTAAILMAVAVILGAMGAHALEKHLAPESIESFATGVRYHIYHALALLVIASVYDKLRFPRVRVAVQSLLIGILLFSGSIYALTIGNLVEVALAPYIWWVTPLGGLLLIFGWAVLASAAWPIRSSNI